MTAKQHRHNQCVFKELSITHGSEFEFDAKNSTTRKPKFSVSSNYKQDLSHAWTHHCTAPSNNLNAK